MIVKTLVKNNKIFDINSSPGFSVSIDESTDISNKKRLITYIEYLHNNVKQTCFLSNVQITTSTVNAENITEVLLEELRSNDIDINKLYGISTDGASVMTG
jgi:NurA-like 5'-3' nuclease